jgi:hypothetical protein
MAPGQRYCLECGERGAPMSSVLMGSSPSHRQPGVAGPAPAPASPPGVPVGDGGGAVQRNSSLVVIAGVGVLLLAMGVGVLIGRSGASKASPLAPQVITVGSSVAGATAPTAETSFTSDWPAGKSGYTVELQTLSRSATTASAVESAKSAAGAKGAKAVGALKSEEFASLSAGSDVIYSGVYTRKPEAETALAVLKKSFPGAKVIKVADGAAGAAAESTAGSTSKGAGSSETHPAPPTVLKSLKGAKGKSYEEKSKALPDVVETG